MRDVDPQTGDGFHDGGPWVKLLPGGRVEVIEDEFYSQEPEDEEVEENEE